MRGFNKSRLIRLWQERDVPSVRSNLLLPILLPIIVMKWMLLGIIAAIIFSIAAAMPRALDEVAQEVRAAKSGAATGKPFKLVNGGEVRQAGYDRKISATRFGASTRSDDLRRRLNELRSVGTGHPAHRPRINGGQYGK